MACNCEKQLIHYLYDELIGEEKRSLRSHLKSCPACREALRELKEGVVEGLKLESIPYPSATEWSNVSAYRRIGVLGWQRIWKPALAGLAVAAAAAAIVVIRFSQPVVNEQPVVIAEHQATTLPSPLAGSAFAKATADRDGKGEGEYAEAPLSPVSPPSVPTGRAPAYASSTVIKGGDESVQLAEVQEDTTAPIHQEPNQSHQAFSGAVAAAPGSATSASVGGTSPAPVRAASGVIDPRPSATPTLAPEQKGKVLIKHNRINPARGEEMTLSIKCDLREHVSIKIYNQMGEPVTVLVDGDLPGGVHDFKWNGTNNHGAILASGVYFIIIESPGFRLREKGVIVK